MPALAKPRRSVRYQVKRPILAGSDKAPGQSRRQRPLRRRMFAPIPTTPLAHSCNDTVRLLCKVYIQNREALDMKLNLAAFTHFVSLQEVLSYVRIRFSIQSVLVDT